MKLPWSLQLLGGLQARSADNNVVSHFRTQKTGALLAYLATVTRSPHSRETLIERFWPDDDWDAARQSLRVALASLRRVLEPEPLAPGAVIAADRVFVRLVDGAFSTDAQAFENAVRHAHLPVHSVGNAKQALGCGAQIQNWEAAIALYGGPFLPGYYDDWILTERDRLHDLWRIAHLRLTACCDETGDWRRGLTVLDALFADAETEGEADRSAEWATDARRLRGRLQTKREAARTRRSTFPAPPPSAVQALLPTDGFWGRETEIAELCDLFHDPAARFITLTGPGGTGKTRLVLQAAAALNKGECKSDDEAAQAIPVHVAPLAALFDARRLPEAIGDALNLPRSKSTNDNAVLDAVIARLNDGPPALLVLDNLEQIAGMEAAQILRTLLGHVPHLTCFATSRRRVGVPGERLFAVSPLPLSDAVSLFTARAQASNPDFALQNETVRADVEALCADLEGIPLAIELAAAWSAALSPHEMRQRLQERFTLLASRRVDKTDRHRSLWAAIAWSYDLLPRDLRMTWERLSVFRGGWTMDAARAIAGRGDDENDGQEIAENLARLRERSLLVCLDDKGHGGAMRFGMLPSLREFAHEQLSEREQAVSRQKHAHYFAELVCEAQNHLRRADHPDWVKRLEAEMPNLRHALHGYADQNQDADEAEYLIFVCAFTAFCRHSGYVRDAREHLDLALARTANVETPNVQAARASAFNAAGLVAWMQGDVPCATAYFEQARAFWQAQNDTKGVGRVLGNLALLAMENDELEKAWELCSEALPFLRQVGDTKPIANALGTMGNARLEQERWAEGRAYHEQSLALYRQMDDMDGVSIALASLGYAAQFEGDFVSAGVYYEESLEIRRDLGDKWRVAFSLVSIANLLWAQKNALPALTLYAATEKLRDALASPMAASRKQEFDEKQAAMRDHAGASASNKAWAKGADMDYDAAVAFALRSIA